MMDGMTEKNTADPPEARNNTGESLTDEVYKILLNRFLKNELVPGNVLNRKEIARELQVSMAPVRDALMRLTMEGFVETLPRKGTIAKAVNREDLYGTFILREAIECQAARMYCGSRVREAREALEPFAREVDDPSVDLVEHWRLDITFHSKLIQLCNCKTLETEFKQVMRVGTFYQINHFLVNEDKEERLSHIDLLEQLSTEDPDTAEKYIREHLKSGKRRFL